jgi:hypothetical protein
MARAVAVRADGAVRLVVHLQLHLAVQEVEAELVAVALLEYVSALADLDELDLVEEFRLGLRRQLVDRDELKDAWGELLLVVSHGHSVPARDKSWARV